MDQKFAVAILIGAFAFAPTLSLAEPPHAPPVSERGKDGKDCVVEDAKLFGYEREIRTKFTKPDAPDEVFLLAWSFSSVVLEDPPKVTNPRGLILVEIKGETGVVQFVSEYGKKKAKRELGAEDLRRFQGAIAKIKSDQLPRLESNRIVRGKEVVVASGRVYVYLHLTAKEGRRVWINNPPTKDDAATYPADDPLWNYSRLIEIFTDVTPADKSSAPSPTVTEPKK